MKRALVVGAGFAGATTARTLAESGEWEVLVIDKRHHVAGNAFDYVNEHGIRVHRYGPHLWHTSNDEVQAWASRFTEWVPYLHHVEAQLTHGRTTPLPINRQTIEDVFEERFYDWAEDNGWVEHYDGECKEGAHAAFLETLVEHHPVVTNSRQHVENSVGKELCDLFFAPYTKKMWGLALEDLPASVAARIPTNVESGSFLYFPKDTHQYLPKDGYTTMVNNILDHPAITVWVGVSRQDVEKENKFDHVFTSEPIDEYFGCKLGALPWRSIKMHTTSLAIQQVLLAPVMNFTHDGPYTRVTEWKLLPAHGNNDIWTTLTFEEPCDYIDNKLERYYPVKTSQRDCPNRALYNQYAGVAEATPNLTFIGRCGTYQYYDMWMVIAQTLKIVRNFLEKQHAEV